ncbi:hypothetical protein KY337_00645 [Candidatus Woesearchaeota archaeon]|nr:hypothetical protein [Candidatus Woesearchaeota archaeon]
MGIQLTPEEMELVKQGRLDPSDIEEHRKKFPVRSVNVNEVDAVKQEIRDVNVKYRESIDRNKELYDLLVENRAEKEKWRNKLAELRKKKKELLGLI